jgi:hypothetical protein
LARVAIQPPRPKRYRVALTQAAGAKAAIRLPILASKMWIADDQIGQV